MEGDDCGAEEHFFCQRTLVFYLSAMALSFTEGVYVSTYNDVVPIPDPAAECLDKQPATDPISPTTFHNTLFEERSCEQDPRQAKTPRNLSETQRPPAKHPQSLYRAHNSLRDNDVEGDGRTDQTSQGHCADSGSDDGWSVTVQRWGWRCRGR